MYCKSLLFRASAGRVVFLGGLLTQIIATSSTHADSFHGINAGAPIWDGSILLTGTKAGAIAATGCRAVRVNFRLDGHAGYDAALLAQYDTVIQNAVDNGLDVLGLLCNEAMSVGQHSFNDDADGDGMNSYVTGFAANARLVIDRYKDRVKRWEIWNEPNAWTNGNYQNDPRNAGGTYILPRVYANLLAETYKRLQQTSILTDYRISLVSGGLFAHEIGGGFSHAMDYMQQVYDQTSVWNALEASHGRRYPWRLFGYHFYLATDETITTSRLNQYFNQARATQGANDDTSPIYITEFGWNSASAGGESGQANNMRIAYNHMETKPYIVGTFWYQWTDESYPYYWGITRASGGHKPSYTEFTAQQADDIPVPEPRVSLVSDRVTVALGGSVRFTPSSLVFPGTSVVASVWNLGGQTQTRPGAPAPVDHVFAAPGEHAVNVLVQDSNGLTGVSNTITIEVLAPAYSPVDFDQDGDVDQTDFARLQICFSGDGYPQFRQECLAARLDSDPDVDGQDFSIFQKCMSGSGVPADPICGT